MNYLYSLHNCSAYVRSHCVSCMAGEGNEYIYMVTATEFSTPLPAENAEESLPTPQGRKHFHVEFAVFVLSNANFLFGVKQEVFLLGLLNQI